MKLKEFEKAYFKRSLFLLFVILIIALFIFSKSEKMWIQINTLSIITQLLVLTIVYSLIRYILYRNIVKFCENDYEKYYVLKKHNIFNTEGVIIINEREIVFIPINERKNSLKHKRNRYDVEKINIKFKNNIIKIKDNTTIYNFKVLLKI